MEKIREILKTAYDKDILSIISQQGGWSAVSYKVSDGRKDYFLKVYDNNRASTSKLTSFIDTYIPITIWLKENTKLSGRFDAER